jgi:intermediate peptidase
MKRFVSTLTAAFDHLNNSPKSTKHTGLLKLNIGLFGYAGLNRPDALIDAANSCIEQASMIVNQVCSAETDQEVYKTVKRVDTVSDILCSVLDATELIRNVHPDIQYVEAANKSCTILHTFLNQLNTHQGLYRVITFSFRHSKK